MASVTSGLHYCYRLLLLFLMVLGPVSLAQGQETPTAPPAGAPTGPEAGPAQPPPQPVPAAPEGGVNKTIQGLPEWLTTPPFREYTPPEGVLPPSVGALEPPSILRLGPPDQLLIPAEFRLQTYLTVDEEYTDNVFQTKDNRQSAFQTNITPGLLFNHNGPTTTLNFTYAPTFFFSTNSEQGNHINQYLTLRGALRPAAHLQFNLEDDYTKSNSSQFNPNLGSAFRGTGNYTINVGNIGGAYIGSQLRTSLTYINNLTINENQSFNNSLTQTGRLSAQYTTPRTTYTGSYSLVRGEFPNATFATFSPDYWEQDVNASASHPLTPTVSLTGSGVFTWHKTSQSLLQRNNYIIGGGQLGGNINVGPTGLLAVEAGAQVYSPENQSTQSTKVYPSGLISYTQQFNYVAIGASYQQGFTANFTDVVPTGPSENRTASLFLRTTAFRDVTASLRGEWIWNRYQQATQFGSAGTTVNTFQLQAQIRYTIVRSLNLTLGYILTNRRSSVAFNEYLENRGLLTLNYAYNIW
jgi:hypothetical protein